MNIELEEHTKADHQYHIQLSTILKLCKTIRALFESSETIEKRAILNYLLQNPTVSAKNLEFTLRKPYNLILQLSGCPVGLDMVREIGTFWKHNKELIWLPNIKQGFFGITQPTEEEMAKYR